MGSADYHQSIKAAYSMADCMEAMNASLYSLEMDKIHLQRFDDILNTFFLKKTGYNSGSITVTMRTHPDDLTEIEIIFATDGLYDGGVKYRGYIEKIMMLLSDKLKTKARIQPYNDQAVILLMTNCDAVKKLKELLDIGAITQEESNRKKKELLELDHSLLYKAGGTCFLFGIIL